MPRNPFSSFTCGSTSSRSWAAAASTSVTPSVRVILTNTAVSLLPDDVKGIDNDSGTSGQFLPLCGGPRWPRGPKIGLRGWSRYQLRLERKRTLDLERARSLSVVAVSTIAIEEQTFTIAEVAEKTGVSAHALRYYERIGLLEVGRQASGHRRFTGHDVDRVVFIGRLRATAMPIREIQRYFALVAGGPGTEDERLAL